VIAAFVIGGLGLAAFVLVELFIAKAPLLDLRLFRKRIFLNASLLGYVSVIALFGAEFLMPLYLQSLRGISALETGLLLLPLAITGGISVTVAGRLYDRIGPRPLVTVGFSILLINTWQLSQLQADASLTWIMFLLALRGIALGLTVQTTLVTALSVVPLPDLARGSSLTNASRNLVQAVGVAVLATILASTISPQIQQFQTAIEDTPRQGGAVAHAGLCALPPDAAVSSESLANLGEGTLASAALELPPLPANPSTLLQQACQESVAGFERAYTLTFFASIAALVLGLMLPGWPRTWAGRRAADMPTAAH
jgi:DHA2 family multidrug resistance protein